MWSFFSVAAMFLVAVMLVTSAATPTHAADVILNEYNAVDGDAFLAGGNSDAFWQQRQGNGGNWFEVAVITDHLDVRGWRIEVVNEAGLPAQASWLLTLSSHAVWSDLRSGTIITFSEQLPNNEDDYQPEVGRWWLNVKASPETQGTFVTVSCIAPACLPADAAWKVSNNASQITIKDDLGAIVFGPAGEGVQPVAGVGSTEVLKLEANPSSAITPLSAYNDGTSSTFGQPNVFAGGTQQQDFSALRAVVPYTPLASVRVNELLSHSDPGVDWIELYNSTTAPIDIGGWFVSDSPSDLTRFEIPAGTVIPPAGFEIFGETTLGFALNGTCGDEVVLSVGNGTTPTGPRDFVQFGPTETGTTFGRSPNGHGRLARLQTPSQGNANGVASYGPVVVNEVMYNPLPPIGTTVDPEFVELYNASATSTALFTDFGGGGVRPWRLTGGVDFEFATTTTIAAGGYLVVVNFDPIAAPADLADFRAVYAIDASVPIVGPYVGKLSNLGDAVRVKSPDTPDANGDVCGGVGNPSPYVPYVTVDEVSYLDFGEWPTSADGLGPSLERIDATAFGNDVRNWVANVALGGTPGSPNSISAGLTSEQKKCLLAMEKNFARVVKAQGKVSVACIKDGSESSLPVGTSVEDCVVADAGGGVAKARVKTETDFTAYCTGLTSSAGLRAPFFGLSDPSTLNDAAILEQTETLHDTLGSDLDVAVIDGDLDSVAARCQQSVVKKLRKCEDTVLKELATCTKNGLASGTVRSTAGLALCLGSDPGGKIAAACDPIIGGVRRELAARCTAVSVDAATAFPGCASSDEAVTAACLDAALRCRTCQYVGVAFELESDCDAFDNGEIDASCGLP